MAKGKPSKRTSAVGAQRVKWAIMNRFNPIRGLTPERLVRDLDSFHMGYLAQAARTWEAMEQRDLYLGNVASKRKKSVARLPWKIETLEESREAKNQAKALEAFYKGIEVTSVLEGNERGGISLLIRQMMDAVGKKFAVHEIVWTTPGGGTGPTAEFRFCPLWWFENRTGNLQFLPTEGAVEGVPMADGEWLVTVGEGIMECSSVAYVFKHLPLKDWLNYSEKFGFPGLLGKTSAAKDSPEWTAMEDAVGNFSNDWAAVCSQQDTIEMVEAKGGAQNLPYPPLVEYCDRAIAARWRGADLSTISQGQAGLGASLQGDETDLILEDDAEMISETLNRQVDRFVLDYTFGPEVETKARFCLIGTSEDEALSQFKRDAWKGFLNDGTINDVLANLTDLKELTSEVGIPVNPDYIDPYLPVLSGPGAPVTGDTITDPEGDVVGGTSAGPGPNDQGPNPRDQGNPNDPNNQKPGETLANEAMAGSIKLVRAARSEFARATAQALQPVGKRIAAILDLPDGLRRDALERLLNEMPSLRAAINKDPANTKALEEALSAGFWNGALSSAANKGKKN